MSVSELTVEFCSESTLMYQAVQQFHLNQSVRRIKMIDGPVMACGLLVDKPSSKKRLLCTYTEFSVRLLIQIDPGENIARILFHVEDTCAVRKLLQIHFIVNSTGRCTLKDNKQILKKEIKTTFSNPINILYEYQKYKIKRFSERWNVVII